MGTGRRGAWASVLGAILLGLMTPGLAEAGPYYRLTPYPIEGQGGLAFDTTGTGSIFGLNVTADYRLQHIPELFTFYAGLRAHGTLGPLNRAYGDNHHLALLAFAKFARPVDAGQSWIPYIITGLGVLHYAGHPNREGV